MGWLGLRVIPGTPAIIADRIAVLVRATFLNHGKLTATATPGIRFSKACAVCRSAVVL